MFFVKVFEIGRDDWECQYDVMNFSNIGENRDQKIGLGGL